MFNILQIKKVFFIIIWLLINLLLMYTHIYFFKYQYIFIFIHGPLSKLLLIFVILYKKSRNYFCKQIPKKKDYINNLITLIVTCYCESLEEIFNTILSLERSFKYSKKDNLLFIVFDGLSKEEGTTDYTWKLLLNKMTQVNLKYNNIEYTKNWKNYDITVDLISCKYNDLNIVLVIKNTNLGKKDSLNFVRDYSINKLDNILMRKINILVEDFGINKEDIVLVGSMDADCVVNEEGILHLYNDISNEDVMGVSGIVLPKQEQKKNFWYIYQLVEYYNTQYITRLSYNYLNQTTCLPGALNIFDMKYYNDTVREKFQNMPNKTYLFQSLVALIGEDRRFTGLYLENNDKKCKTLINEKVKIYTSLPDTTKRFQTQRRRWITSSLLNNIHDLKNPKLSFFIKYNTFTTTLCAYLMLYIIFFLFIFTMNFFSYDIKFYNVYNDDIITMYYRFFIYFITFIIILFQITFLFKMENYKERLQYILGMLIFLFFVVIIIFWLILNSLYKMDSLKWGNIKQNKEDTNNQLSIQMDNNDVIIDMEKIEKMEIEISYPEPSIDNFQPTDDIIR